MKRLGRALGVVEGMIEATAWAQQGGQRMVATSAWQSEEAFRKAIPLIGNAIKDVPFAQWEEKPRELFRLSEIP